MENLQYSVMNQGLFFVCILLSKYCQMFNTSEFQNYCSSGKSVLKSSAVDTKFMAKWYLGIGEGNKCAGESAF